MDFDLVSDVHIDYWDIRLPLKYPCGSRKHAPCQLTPMSNILVVAGDVECQHKLQRCKSANRKLKSKKTRASEKSIFAAVFRF